MKNPKRNTIKKRKGKGIHIDLNRNGISLEDPFTNHYYNSPFSIPAKRCPAAMDKQNAH